MLLFFHFSDLKYSLSEINFGANKKNDFELKDGDSIVAYWLKRTGILEFLGSDPCGFGVFFAHIKQTFLI